MDTNPSPPQAGLSPYRSPKERDEVFEYLARRAGGELHGLGSSVLGAGLRAVRLPTLGKQSDQRVLLVGGIHGPEWIGVEVVLGFLEAMGSCNPTAERLRQMAEIWVLACLNPDGYARTWEQRGCGRLADLRGNAHGVDLNRNFPRPTLRAPLPFAFAGSTRPASSFYRGPCALSEPEASALDCLVRNRAFRVAASLHSNFGVLIPPKVRSAYDARGYRRLCRVYQAAQPLRRARRIGNRFLDVFTGELEDHLHHVYGCWSLCIETFSPWPGLNPFRHPRGLFWRFNPVDPRPWIENEVPALLAYFMEALTLGPPRDQIPESGAPAGEVKIAGEKVDR